MQRRVAATWESESYAKVVFEGEDPGDKFGQGLAAGGDLNGDGTTDIVIASNLHDAEATHAEVGRVYVFLMPNYSAGWPSSGSKRWSASNANIIIDGPDNDNFVRFGHAVACNGNTNKGTDSRADILVGAPRADTCSYNPEQLRQDRGFAYLFRCTGTVAAGPSGDHLSWAAGSQYVDFYRIKCLAGTYDNEAPFLARSVLFLEDIDGDADNDDELMFGVPGWDTSYYGSGPADNRGCVYVVPY